MGEEKLFIREDITDWMDEVLRDELVLSGEQDVVQALDEGVHTAKIARAAIVSREIGEAPEDIVRPNKILLTVGAMADVSSIAHQQKVEMDTADGRTIRIPGFVGQVGAQELNGNGEEEKGPSYVRVDSQLALERAEAYLQNQVIGHIRNRLAVIHLNQGDMLCAVETLKDKIDELVSEFS